MGLLRVGCGTCGNLHECEAEEVHISVVEDQAQFSFWCGMCETTVTVNLDEETVERLIDAGATSSEWSSQPDLSDTDPPLDQSDLSCFLELLQDDECVAEAMAHLITELGM